MADDARALKIDRNVSLAVVMALVVQTAGALLWAGAAAERITQLERSAADVGLANERLARLEAQAGAMHAQLDRIEARLDALSGVAHP